MKVCLKCDAGETAANIGIAKALTEVGLTAKDLNEIARYLIIFADNNKERE